MRLRQLGVSALCALALLVAAAPPAGAQTSVVPDSMWEEYSPGTPGDPSAAPDGGWDRSAALAVALVATGLLACALVGVLVARRRLAPAPAEAAAPEPEPPDPTLWIPSERVVPPLAPVEERVPPAPIPFVGMAPDPPPRASRRYDDLYDAVYERELERIALRREQIRRRQQRREG